jgi:hypothetical protein
MSLSKVGMAFIGIGICSVGSLAMAADDAAGPKISSEIRASLKSSDNQLYKVDGGTTPVRTNNFGVDRLKLQLKGNVDESTDYRLRLDLNNPTAGLVDYAYGTWWATKQVGIRMGKDKVQQGGIFNMTNGVYDISAPIYAANQPHATYKPMLDVELKIAGTISLQLFDDQAPAAAQWHTADQQPAFAVAYIGDFSGSTPRLQFGSYDNNHSMYVSAGSGIKLAGIDGFVNYIYDRQSHKDSATSADPKDKYDVLTSIEVGAKYAVTKQIEPSLNVSVFDRKQDGTDSKVNSVTPATTAGAKPTVNWDDNGTVVTLAAFYHASAHAHPFFAYDMKSGKFAKNFVATSTIAETHTEMTTRLGMAVEF